MNEKKQNVKTEAEPDAIDNIQFIINYKMITFSGFTLNHEEKYVNFSKT